MKISLAIKQHHLSIFFLFIFIKFRFIDFNGQKRTGPLKISTFAAEIKSVKSQRKVFTETYGCQMNFSDTEIILSVLREEGYVSCDEIREADVILLNTCSIRDNAEQRVLNRLQALSSM